MEKREINKIIAEKSLPDGSVASQSFEGAVMHHASLCCPLVTISLNFFDCFAGRRYSTATVTSGGTLLSRILAKLQLWLGSLTLKEAEHWLVLRSQANPSLPGLTCGQAPPAPPLQGRSEVTPC